MLLINTKGKDFKQYIKSLTDNSRHQYRISRNKNRDVKYSKAIYNEEQMNTFMRMWEQQLIRGTRRHWAFPVGYVTEMEKKGLVKCFTAVKQGEVIALQFVEQHGSYVECHPVMWDKSKYAKRDIAKFMWFSLIEYFIKLDGVDWLNLGCRGDNWQDSIIRRKEFPEATYKWVYVPQEVKEHPEKEPKYSIKIENKKKILYIK